MFFCIVFDLVHMHFSVVYLLLKMLAIVSCFRMDSSCQGTIRKLSTFHICASVAGPF